MHKQAGFALLEIFLIVGALIIISAIAAPSVVAWRDDVRLSAATERFGDDVQKAKSRAVRDGKTVIIELNSNTYRVFVDTTNSSGGPPNGAYDPNEPVVCDRQLPRGIRMKLNDTASTIVAPLQEVEDLPVEIEGLEVDANLQHGESQPAEQKGLGTGQGLTSELRAPNNENSEDDENQSADSDLTADKQEPAYDPARLSFDYIGRCLNPQTIVLQNSRGKKKLVAINTLANVKVIKID